MSVLQSGTPSVLMGDTRAKLEVKFAGNTEIQILVASWRNNSGHGVYNQHNNLIYNTLGEIIHMPSFNHRVNPMK